ncbi:MAG TPA: hypothetical protein VE177_03875, partial [Candidatus Binatus sp.]|nr:hypothetical protein [Candidatus Binatus sp.]
TGTLIAGMIVGLSPGDRSDIIRRMNVMLDEYLWYFFPVLSQSGDNLMYCLTSLALPNVTKAREIVDWVKSQAGVANARIEFSDQQITLLENLDADMITRTPAFARFRRKNGYTSPKRR